MITDSQLDEWETDYETANNHDEMVMFYYHFPSIVSDLRRCRELLGEVEDMILYFFDRFAGHLIDERKKFELEQLLKEIQEYRGEE